MDADGNGAGWDLLADAYQEHVGWPEDDLAWGIGVGRESELGVLADVARGRALVLGCGGGQDLVALDRLGFGPLVGVDASPGQLRHAARRCAGGGIDATLVAGDAADLVGLVDGPFDAVVSVQALNYVADAARLFAGVRSVLRPGGTLAFSVVHPADVSTSDVPPHRWERSYFEVERDWVWDGLAPADVPLRSWYRSPSDWFTLVTGAGLTVERLLEPPSVPDPRWRELGWLDADGERKLALVPGTIVLRARR